MPTVPISVRPQDLARRSLVVVIVGFALTLPTRAATFVVDSLGDQPDLSINGICRTSIDTCTLRAALQEVARDDTPDDVTFSVSGIIQIGSALPPQRGPFRLLGPGAGNLTVVCAACAGILFVIDSPQLLVVQREIADLTITGAGEAIRLGDTGFINDLGDQLALRRVVFRDNERAIRNNGLLAVTDSTFDHNGDFSDPPPPFPRLGAAIFNDATLSVSGSLFAGNHATSGGALSNNVGATATISNTTFTFNDAFEHGGAISNAGALALDNVTIADNVALVGGGGVSSLAGTTELANTILSRNSGSPANRDCEGTLTSLGHNYVGDCPVVGDTTGNIVPPSSDARLFALADNGGPTRTRLPRATSLVLDAGSNATCELLDQRGAPRPRDGNGDGVAACDMGAAELQLGSFFALTPCRLLDTRVGGSPLVSGADRLLTVPPNCSVSPAAKAVALNLTVVEATRPGFVTAYPGGGTLPPTSTVSFAAAQTRANNAVIPLSANGNGLLALRATLAGGGTVHLVVDVTGYFE